MNEIAYNTFSQVTSLKTGAGTTDPDVEQYSYDGQTGLLTNQTVIHTNTSATLLDLSYDYNRGNSTGTLSGKTGQLTHITNNIDHNKDRSFEYDALGRLTAAKGGLATGATGVTANWSQTYGYDRYGNRTSVTANGITADSNNVPADGIPSLSYDSASNRITPNGTTGWQYDLAGNLVRGQNASGVWQRFEYDAAGRLVKVKDDSNNVIETYTYGADRNRLINEYSTGRTYYAWGGNNPVVEYTEATNSSTPVYAKSYIYCGERLLSTATNVSGSEITEFHHPDRLGTKVVTKPSASSSFEQSTLPFGTALDAESSGYSNQTFTSYDRSTPTGLDYAVNRSYSPGQSRFTQVDPIGLASGSDGNPQSLNLYTYTQNNPIDFADPSGLNRGYCFGYYVLLSTDGGKSWEEIGFIPVYCWEEGGGSGGDPGGGGAGGNGQTGSPAASQTKIPPKCAEALKKVGLLNKVQQHLNDPIIDVDKIQNEPASTYFGNTGTANLTAGQFFDQHTESGGAYTERAGNTAPDKHGKTKPIGITGIYRRKGAAGMSDGLRLHETTHLVQPKAKDLDAALVSLLKVDATGKSDTDALNDYFNSGCDPKFLKK